MKKMFCIIGLTGAGKSTYLNYAMKYKGDIGFDSLKRLVYHTTRRPRDNEKDGIDYYFDKKKPADLVVSENPNTGGVTLIKNPNLIEDRMYTTLNNGIVHYYTTVDCVKDDYYLCAPSIEQLASYLKYFGPDKIYVIEIDTDIKTRIRRVLDMRSKTDDDVYELCRRVVQEKVDWEKAGKDNMVIHQLRHYLLIDNSKDSDFQKNADELMDYIKEQYCKDR